jgi:hypothetical protein
MLRRGAKPPFLSSSERFARLGELCSADETCAIEAAALGAFLTDTHLRIPEANEYCSVYNPCTVYSTLFAPKQGRMWVRATDRSDRTFQAVS